MNFFTLVSTQYSPTYITFQEYIDQLKCMYIALYAGRGMRIETPFAFVRCAAGRTPAYLRLLWSCKTFYTPVQNHTTHLYNFPKHKLDQHFQGDIGRLNDQIYIQNIRQIHNGKSRAFPKITIM